MTREQRKQQKQDEQRIAKQLCKHPARFKEGQKVTYCGDPGIIKAVNYSIFCDYPQYTISYTSERGNRCQATNIRDNGQVIKPA